MILVGRVAGGAFALLLLCTFFVWPYRAESVEGVVSGHATTCDIGVTSNGGWRDEVIPPGILASRVAYPLKMIAFVEDCRGVPDGRPHATELVSVSSGKVVARGVSCAGVDHSEGYPCRLEMPPIAVLEGQDRYVVRVVRQAGDEPVTAQIQLILKREWRSVVYDALLSV